MLSAIKANILMAAAAKPAANASDAAEKAFPPLDPATFPSQIFWLLLSFFVLYFLLSKIFLPRIGETLEERSSRIADDLDAASRMQREAEEAEKAYKQALSDARAKASNVAETTRQSVDAELEAELAEADAEAAAHAAVAESRIRDVRKAALANIEVVAADAAQATIEALTGKKVTTAKAKAALN
ncbi:F0F1 ATP synthase subunit B' [Litorimonas sp. RW-G-Af-16]|uniref:F0F1 ATP synthase subunit B family protein n=1 Tax=Litorimonas sp. RW-G-Af-16 TaxID=3241168 RepID=UPI00390CC6CB